MAREELIVEIDAHGRVRVEVNGMPGKQCLDYIPIFQSLLSGEVQQEELTSEYYQAEEQTHVEQRLRRE